MLFLATTPRSVGSALALVGLFLVAACGQEPSGSCPTGHTDAAVPDGSGAVSDAGPESGPGAPPDGGRDARSTDGGSTDGSGSGEDAATPPGPGPEWTLVFADEFDDSSLDGSKWDNYFRWGPIVINNELQAYVPEACEVRDGRLHLVARRQPGRYGDATLDYTSCLITSRQEWTYGYFEARVRVPAGQGLWPAFWLYARLDGTVAEIDVLEVLGHEPNRAHMTVHWGPDYSAHRMDTSTFEGPDFSADFHTFAMEWSETSVVWYIDGVERFRHEGEGVPHEPMYVIANLAVGGNWPGAPDETTPFPSAYEIDYIRVYQRAAP